MPFVVALVVFAIIFEFLRNIDWAALGFVAIVFALCGVIVYYAFILPSRASATEKYMAARAAAVSAIARVIDGHIETLSHRRNALVRTDQYGVIDDSAWKKELNHFVLKVVFVSLREIQSGGFGFLSVEEVSKIVEDTVREYSEIRSIPLVVSEGMTAIEFEGLCAAVLRRMGWNASTTKASGDQGADVVAYRDGAAMVVQCKLYKSAVGNKAVQEVIAAREYYKAQSAVVVTTSTFTKSAHQLAQTANVRLLHFTEFEKFLEKFLETTC